MPRCHGGVRLEAASAGYPGFTLGPVDLEVREGTVAALIGPNASGKTTLLRLLAGVLRLRSGRVSACGHEAGPGGRVDGERVASYLPAAPQADPWARVGEILEAAGAGEPGWLGVPSRRRFGELSSGQKRLVCLARALGRARPLLLADEPTAFLDVARQALVLGLLRRHAEEGGVVIAAMHELHLVETLADVVVVVSGGRIVASGPPGEVLNPSLLSRVYGVELVEYRSPEGLRALAPRPLNTGGPPGPGGGAERLAGLHGEGGQGLPGDRDQAPEAAGLGDGAGEVRRRES